MNINTLEGDEAKGIVKEIEVGRREEEMSQLTIYTLEEVAAKTFIRKLAEGEKFQNWDTQEAPLVFKI
jgi:hypothetical protein